MQTLFKNFNFQINFRWSCWRKGQGRKAKRGQRCQWQLKEGAQRLHRVCPGARQICLWGRRKWRSATTTATATAGWHRCRQHRPPPYHVLLSPKIILKFLFQRVLFFFIFIKIIFKIIFFFWRIMKTYIV